MPQPISVSSHGKPHRLLLQRPEHAARIAAIAGQWTEVEAQLAELLGAAFGSSKKDVNGAHHISRNWIALAAIRNAETIRVRLKIMDNTLGKTLRQNAPLLSQEWSNLKNELEAQGKKRNRIVHGSWSLSPEYPQYLLLEEKDGELKRYTVRDLDDILDRIVSVWQQCYTFQRKILEEKLTGTQFLGSIN